MTKMRRRRKITSSKLQAKAYAPYARGALFFENRRIAVCPHQHTNREAAERCAQQMLRERQEREAAAKLKQQQKRVAA